MKIVGGLIDALKKDHKLKHRHHNPYLEKAVDFSDILMTQQELKSNPELLHKTDCHTDLIIEIGCYFGKTVVDLATLNPLASVLGVDITYKRVVKTAQKIKQANLNNAYVALCDGLFLFKDVLQDNSVQGVCVFFPDPWLKTRQSKHRLLNQEFIELVFAKLKLGGFLWIKTDHQPYFLNTEFLLLKKGFTIDHNIPPKFLNSGSYQTEFQKLFTRKNVPFFEGVYIK